MPSSRHPFPSAFLVLVLAIALAGCKSGDGPPAAGAVTILVADGPALDLDHVWVEFERVALIPRDGGDHVIVFEGHERIDLLRYRSEDFILAAGSEVPAGHYAKVRLEIAAIDVEPQSACPGLKLPSGKIDLNPRGPFEIGSGEALVLRIDLDARKSIFVHEAGSGKCIFRPVVFVDVLDGFFRCRQEAVGTISAIRLGDGPRNDDGSPWDDAKIAELLVDLGPGRGDLTVEIGDGTAIFDAAALPAGIDALAVGDRVLVRGIMAEGDVLKATWAIEGEPVELLGEFEGAIAGSAFAFLTPDRIDGRTTDGTLAFGSCEAPVALGSILSGQPARILGTLVLEDDASFVRAAVIDVGPFEAIGEIIGLDLAGRGITVRGDEGDATFAFDAATRIVLVGDGALSAEDLRIGQTVEARLDPVLGVATTIAVEPAELEGEADALYLEARSFALLRDGEDPVAVTVAPDAAVLLIEGDDVAAVDLVILADGDAVILFGLVPEAGIFDARTVVIRR